MPVPVPNLVGNHTGGSITMQSSKTQKKKNDNGEWTDWTRLTSNSYPEWQVTKSEPVKTSVQKVAGMNWRPPTTYRRNNKRWSYDTSQPEPEWYETGIRNSAGIEYGGIAYSGCDFGDTHFTDFNVPSHPSMDDLIQGAKTECVLKMSEQKVNLAQFMAESKQTAEMLAGAGTELLELIKMIKRGQIRNIPSYYGRVRKGANLWLQYQFGWKPLMSDIYAIHDQLTNGLNRRHIVSASRTKKASGGFPGRFYGLDFTSNMTSRATCKLWAEVDSALLTGAQSYGLLNPLSLGWELVPYSFVLDWFIPVGNTLSALTATAGLNFIDGFVSTCNEGTGTLQSNRCGSATVKQLEFSRNRLNTWPDTRKFYANANPFSSTRIANMLALLKQLR